VVLELGGVLGWLKQAGIMLCCFFLLGRVCVSQMLMFGCLICLVYYRYRSECVFVGFMCWGEILLDLC